MNLDNRWRDETLPGDVFLFREVQLFPSPLSNVNDDEQEEDELKHSDFLD